MTIHAPPPAAPRHDPPAPSASGAAADAAPALEPVALAARSRWGAKLAARDFATSVEIVPPRGIDASGMLADVARLEAAGVDAVNVPDGPRAQLRMSALITGAMIARATGVEPIVHYTCRDRNLIGIASDLLGAAAIGIRNFLVIRGDSPRMGALPSATGVFDVDAVGLARILRDFNRGIDPSGSEVGARTRFVVGVGANPTCADLDAELDRLAEKAEAGADFAVTQPIFDADALERFVARLPAGHIPIVPALWPLVSLRNAHFLREEMPWIALPDAVLDRMRRADERSRSHAAAEGVAIARELLERLRAVAQGVQIAAPLGKIEPALQLLGA
jgi:homocysteine S-methyltransferase